MAEIKWIKIVVDIFDNRKIKQIEKLPEADAIIIIWFKLLCLAGELNENGLIMITKDVPYTDEMLANAFNKPITTIRLALDVFQKFNMIEIINNIYCVNNWEKYQNVDGLDKIKEQTRKRVSEYRKRQKQLMLNTSNVTGNVTVTQCNETEEEKEIEEEKDIYIKNEKENKIIEIYNFNCPKLPKVQKLTDKRKKSIKTFLKEFSVEQFEAICKIANSSDFLTGNKGEGWRADFDFLMRVDKATSVLEGKYSSNNKDNKVPTEQKIEYKEVEMTEEEYIQKLENGGKRYV